MCKKYMKTEYEVISAHFMGDNEDYRVKINETRDLYWQVVLGVF